MHVDKVPEVVMGRLTLWDLIMGLWLDRVD